MAVDAPHPLHHFHVRRQLLHGDIHIRGSTSHLQQRSSGGKCNFAQRVQKVQADKVRVRDPFIWLPTNERN